MVLVRVLIYTEHKSLEHNRKLQCTLKRFKSSLYPPKYRQTRGFLVSSPSWVFALLVRKTKGSRCAFFLPAALKGRVIVGKRVMWCLPSGIIFLWRSVWRWRARCGSRTWGRGCRARAGRGRRAPGPRTGAGTRGSRAPDTAKSDLGAGTWNEAGNERQPDFLQVAKIFVSSCCGAKLPTEGVFAQEITNAAAVQMSSCEEDRCWVMTQLQTLLTVPRV